MEQGDVKLFFLYDQNGLFGFDKINTNGTKNTFYYRIDARGEIVAIVNAYGNVVANYNYDPWGKILSVKTPGGTTITNTENIALLNPFRYKSYVYDNETGLYYLNSRYYDPEVCRFVSRDKFEVLTLTPTGLTDKNLFNYCDNNPVMRKDVSGQAWETVFDVISLGFSIAEVADDPTNPWAWVALAGDVIDVAVPFVGGVGESVKFMSKAAKTLDAVDDVNDSMKIISTVDRIPSLDEIAGGACFIAGTVVHTETGQKPIETIKVGDNVWAWDENTDTTALKKVVETYINETTELVHITVGNEKITTTPSHPFYSPQKGWTDAIDLRAGDILVLLNGEYVIVESVQHELFETPIKVYNFQVEDYHTYYVSDSAVLVHNMCAANPGGRHGGPAHREMISKIKNDLSQKGWDVSSKESRVYLDSGKYRYPDIIARKDGVTRFYQVGRATASGRPVSRELNALRDLGKHADEIYFVPYNRR